MSLEQYNYIFLDTNTVFYKKVLVKTDDSLPVGTAVIRLISTQPGILPKYEQAGRKIFNYDYKCRFAGAIVHSLVSYYDCNIPPVGARFISSFDRNTEYKIGAEIIPNSFDYTPVACSNGIHGFLRYEDAKKYYL